MNKVLVFAVHPDDETLGCGGTLLKHKANGDEIHWLIVTSTREEHGFEKSKVLQDEKEIEAVAEMYKFDGVHRLDLPVMKLDELPLADIINRISKVVDEVRSNIVYLPFKGDVHSHHRVIFNAAYSSVKNFRNPFVKKILMMETISETEFSSSLDEFAFIPNYLVDISDFLDKKLNIMRIFKDEIGPHPFPRSLENIRAFATFRGAMAGCKYAEGFMLLKEVM